MTITKHFDSVRLLGDWTNFFTEKEMGDFSRFGVLIPAVDTEVLGMKVCHEVEGQVSEFEFIQLENELHLLSTNYESSPIAISADKKLRPLKFSRDGFLAYFQKQNLVSTCVGFIAPTQFLHLGSKNNSNGGRLHYLLKEKLNEADLSILFPFLEHHVNGNERFIFLISNPSDLISLIPPRLADICHFTSLPKMEFNFLVNPSIVYGGKFGFSFSQVLSEVGQATMIIEKKTGRISFCGCEVTSSKTDVSKVLMHLVERAGQKLQIDDCIDSVLVKDEIMCRSKILSNQKVRFQRSISEKFGKNSMQFKLAKQFWPDLDTADRKLTMVNPDVLPVILL